MKKAKNVSVVILVSAILCCWGGVLTGCDTNTGSGGSDNEYVKDDAYASDFYLTQYAISCVRDVFRSPSIPSEDDESLLVYKPGNPYRPDNGYQYSNAELENVEYFVLRKSTQKDRYDEYAVFATGAEQKIGTGGRIMCFGKEGFLYLCGGYSGTYYGTFFFTKYGYEKFTKNNNQLTYDFYKLNLGHDDVAEIFGSAN